MAAMLKLHKFHGMEGHITVVMGKPGRKWIHYVEVGYPIRVRKVKVSEAKFFRELTQTTTVQAYLDMADRLGITEGAIKLLKEAASNGK
jgi:hypothetical protein